MKTYNVDEIAQLLAKNPETIRRWIRNNKLHATQTSRKTGHVITEKALEDFLKTSPKYAKEMSAISIAAKSVIAAVSSASVAASLVAKQCTGKGQLESVKLSSESITEEIAMHQRDISEWQNKINELNEQIDFARKKIAELEVLNEMIKQSDSSI